MRVTRRSLEAEVIQIRSQLAVHNHISRAELHRMLKQVTDRNTDLVNTIKRQETEIERLTLKLAEVKAATEAVAA